MTTLFEQQGVQYEMQGDYKLPCVTLPNDSDCEIGVWGERHRRYLKEHHKVRYYNLLTAGTFDTYLADIENQAQEMFEQTVKSLAENENVTEKMNRCALQMKFRLRFRIVGSGCDLQQQMI